MLLMLFGIAARATKTSFHVPRVVASIHMSWSIELLSIAAGFVWLASVTTEHAGARVCRVKHNAVDAHNTRVSHGMIDRTTS